MGLQPDPKMDGELCNAFIDYLKIMHNLAEAEVVEQCSAIQKLAFLRSHHWLH